MGTRPANVTVSVIDTYGNGNDFNQESCTEKISSVMQVKTVVKKHDAGECCSFCNKRYCKREESNRWDVFDCIDESGGDSGLGYFIVCSGCRYFAAYQIHNVKDKVFLQYADDDVWFKSDAYYPMNYG
jgi:hypothetical protein